MCRDETYFPSVYNVLFLGRYFDCLFMPLSHKLFVSLHGNTDINRGILCHLKSIS